MRKIMRTFIRMRGADGAELDRGSVPRGGVGVILTYTTTSFLYISACLRAHDDDDDCMRAGIHFQFRGAAGRQSGPTGRDGHFE